MLGLNTILIHGDIKNNKGEHGRSLKTPIYETASYDFDNAQDMEDAFSGTVPHFVYSRTANPTVAELQNRIKLLTQAENVLCLSSGMAAITNVILTLCQAGDSIIASHYLFGNTYSLLKETLSEVGIETIFVDLEDLEAVENAITPTTRILFAEVLTNPQLKLFDFEKLGQICQKHNIPFMADNTALTPYLFQAKKYNIDIEIISNTKFFSGGATSLGGSIIMYPSKKYQSIPLLKDFYTKYGDLAFFKRLTREVFRNLGACLSPNNAYLQLLGLETLSLRIDQVNKNAQIIADYLIKHPKVVYVSYAGSEHYIQKERASYYCNNKGGALIEVRLQDKKTCYQFMDSLQIIRRATNFCDNKTMIIHPHSTIFVEYSEEKKSEFEVYENSLRLSIGIEDIEDLLEDLETAFNLI